MSARTLESLTVLRQVREEIAATRARLLHDVLTAAERAEECERLAALTGRAMALENPAAAPESAITDAAQITPTEAATRAKAIRARPEFWRPHMLGEDGSTPLITGPGHERLVRELLEYDARASEPDDDAA